MTDLRGGARWKTKTLAGLIAGVAIVLSGGIGTADAQSLTGSHASLIRQRQWARSHDYTYLRTVSDVRRFVSRGWLVRVPKSADVDIVGASFPYARPEVRTFIERLGSQYRRACGERLVVTSLTRPRTRQPRNASRLSVHPTGMAMDLRRSRRASCRSWLEGTLLSLERQGVLEATREHRPPHYHVALFPKPYVQYVASLGQPAPEIAEMADDGTYRVRRGDSLWTIADAHGVSVRVLKVTNGLRSSRIVAGQELVLPTTMAAVSTADGGGTEAVDDGGARIYRVRRGDSLWSIADQTGTTIERLKAANGLRNSRIDRGQKLVIPLAGEGA